MRELSALLAPLEPLRNKIFAWMMSNEWSTDSFLRMSFLILLLFVVMWWMFFHFIPGLIMDWHLRHIPTAPGKLPFLGHALQLMGGSPCAKMAKWSLEPHNNNGADSIGNFAEKVNRVVKFNVMSQRVVYTNEPAILKRILLTNQRNYCKDIASSYKHFMCLLGSGLVTAEGEKWKKGRLLLSHALRIDIIEEIPEMAMKAVGRVMEKLANKDRDTSCTDLNEEFRHMTLQVIGETALSFTPEETDRIFPALYLPIVHECNRRVWEPWRVLMVTSKGYRQRRQCLNRLNKVLCEIIQKRWENRHEAHKRDVMALCMSQIDKMDKRMILQLRDDVKTMLLAGHETSAALLTWASYELIRHPEICAKVRDEAKQLFDPKRCTVHIETPYGTWGIPTADEVRKMLHWTPAVLRESLRMHNIVPLVMRLAVKNDTWVASETGLDYDVVIPSGCSVAVGIQAVHHRPDIWPDPDSFKPERFMDVDIPNNTNTMGMTGAQTCEKSIDPYTFIPFINGPRNCLGQHLAIVETQVALAYLFLNWDLSLFNTTDSHGKPNLSLEEEAGKPHEYMIPTVPQNGLKVIGTQRINK